MPRYPVVSLVLATLLAACGGTRAAAPVMGGETQTPVRVLGGAGERGGQLNTVSNYRGVADRIGVPIDRAWAAMPAVYSELGIDFKTLDHTQRVIGNDALRARRQLGKLPLSRYFSCGGDGGRDNADSYDVTMSVRTQLVPDGAAGTTVATAVQATARSRLFSSAEVACTSTQRLEDSIAKLLQEKAGA